MLAASKRLHFLKMRASLLRAFREAFFAKNIQEVDLPSLSSSASIDAHIDLIETKEGDFLFSSPEYGMKRLLSEGIGDIYQISHVFRKNERSFLHQPEFTLIEWYRVGMDYFDFIDETLEFLQLALPESPPHFLTYHQAFESATGLCCVKATLEELQKVADKTNWDRATIMDYLFSEKVEPTLQDLTVIMDYPKEQAALSRIRLSDRGEVASRFEIYFKGIELCNGYHELADPIEQRERFERSNQKRLKMGKSAYPLDEKFLAALELGFPNCCGVAVGFDRLLMLNTGAKNIQEVLPLP